MKTPIRIAQRSVIDRVVVIVGAVMVWGLFAQHAKPYVLTHGNSQLIISPVPVTGSSWIVDGVEHMKELSNWYRVGSSGPESNVSSLIIGAPTFSGTNMVTIPYTDPLGRFALEIDYSVFGGALGSGLSAFDEEIRIKNLSSTNSLVFHFFEYIDLDLTTTPGDDTVLLTSKTSLQQYDSQTVGNWGMDVDRYELSTYPLTLNKLTSTGPDNLSSVWPNGQGPVGPGDVTFALQWDFIGVSLPRPAIPPLQTAIITKEGLLQMSLVPEPASGALIMTAIVFGVLPPAHRRR